MTSLSFDRAAGFYDQTRDLPQPIATAGIDALLRYAQPRPGALIIEVGAGTGRISVPLLERGANWVGCDLSRAMLLRLRGKRPAARIALADAVQLPFAAGAGDALLTIHVLHLVGAWRAALREFRRVLRPGGVYINTWNWHDPQSVGQRLRDYWRSRVEAHGAQWRRPGIETREELLDEVRRMGAQVEEVLAARFYSPTFPQSVVDSLAGRVTSDAWEVPDDILALTIAELRAYATETCGDDLSRPVQEERRFLVDVIRFS